MKSLSVSSLLAALAFSSLALSAQAAPLTQTCSTAINLFRLIPGHSDIGGSIEGGPDLERSDIYLGQATVTVSVDPVQNTCQGKISFLQDGATAPVQSSFSCAVTRDSLRRLNNTIFFGTGVSTNLLYKTQSGDQLMDLGMQGLKWTNGLHEVLNPATPDIPDVYNVSISIRGFNGKASGGFSIGQDAQGNKLSCK